MFSLGETAWHTDPGCHLGGGGTTQLHMEKWKHFSILNWPRSLKSKQAAITAINYYRGKEQERENMNERKWEQQKGWIRGEWWGWGEGHKRERDVSEMRGEMVRRGGMGQDGGKKYTFILLPLCQETRVICL